MVFSFLKEDYWIIKLKMIKNIKFQNKNYLKLKFLITKYIYNWGLGIGDWGLGVGGWGPNPKPKNPNPKPPNPKKKKKI